MSTVAAATPSLEGRHALVTGASSGIGRAVACALSAAGARLWLLGRDAERLAQTRAMLATPQAHTLAVDITDRAAVAGLADAIPAPAPDVLVHCAGLYARGTVAETATDDFTAAFDVNVAGVYDLTRTLLERLVDSRGDIVFVNSSIVRRAVAGTGTFAATQHALKALADSLREEVNDRGVRVTSLYPGRTATPRQERIFEYEGRDYRPERLLQADDVAAAVLACLALPRSAEVTDLHIRPAMK